MPTYGTKVPCEEHICALPEAIIQKGKANLYAHSVLTLLEQNYALPAHLVFLFPLRTTLPNHGRASLVVF